MPRKAAKTANVGNIEKRGDVYRLRLGVGGRRHRFTFPPGTSIEAVRRFAVEKSRELETEAAKRKKRERRGIRTGAHMSELFDVFEGEYLPTLAVGTQGAYRDSLKVIRPFFLEQLRDPTVDAIGGRDVEAFLAWRRVTPLNPKRTPTVSNRTVQKDRAVLHRIFDVAERRELRDGNPVRKTEAPKVTKHTPVILTDDGYAKLLEACGDRPMLRLYVTTLGEGGMRSKSEGLWLRWEDVDLDGGFVWIASTRVHRTKGGKGRWTPMTPALAAAMRTHFAAYRMQLYGGKRSPWIFHHERTRRHHVAGERIKSFDRAIRAAAARAKLPDGWRPHDLRHRRVTTWLAEGKSAVHVMEAVGHADLRTTMDYTHLAREHLRALVDAPAPAAAAKRARSPRKKA